MLSYVSTLFYDNYQTEQKSTNHKTRMGPPLSVNDSKVQYANLVDTGNDTDSAFTSKDPDTQLFSKSTTRRCNLKKESVHVLPQSSSAAVLGLESCPTGTIFIAAEDNKSRANSAQQGAV